MESQFSRTEILLGKEGMEKLAASRVAVFGIGGVGGYVCEALVRSGVGSFILVDRDRVSVSNLNRQIIALHSTVGRYKVDVMKERMLDINPHVAVETYPVFFLPENENEFSFAEYDYVVDAVDTVTAKIALAERCREAGVPLISSMGAGNKLEAGDFRVADLYSTKVCPLAKVMRRELKKRGIDSLKVVYSEELPITLRTGEDGNEEGGAAENSASGRPLPGSVAFVPSACGLVIAGEVVRDLCGAR